MKVTGAQSGRDRRGLPAREVMRMILLGFDSDCKQERAREFRLSFFRVARAFSACTEWTSPRAPYSGRLGRAVGDRRPCGGAVCAVASSGGSTRKAATAPGDPRD